MNPDLLWIALSLVTWGIGEGMFLYFQPLYLQELGASPLVIGSLLGMVGLFMTVSYIPAGYISDTIGRRPMLRIAWFIGFVATGIMALANSLPVFIAGMSLYGLTSFVVVPLNSYITQARGNWSVGRTITLISASFNFGVILGPLIGGWIGDQYGLQRSFQIAAVFFLVSTVIIFMISEQPVASRTVRNTQPIRQTLSNKSFLQYLALIFFVMITLYLPQSLSQNYLQNVQSLSLTQIGQLIAIRSFGIVILNLLLGHINARVGFLLSQVAVAGFTLFLWQGTSMAWYAAGYFLLGGYHTARALAVAQGSVMIKGAYLGVGYGFIETSMSAAIIIAPPLAGFLYEINPTYIYSVSTILIGISILASIYLLPVYRSDLIPENKKAPLQ